jgi:hypothetical protein
MSDYDDPIYHRPQGFVSDAVSRLTRRDLEDRSRAEPTSLQLAVHDEIVLDKYHDPYDALYISLTGKHLAPGGLTREQFLLYVAKQKEQRALEIWNSGPFGRSDTAGHQSLRGRRLR